MKSAIICMAMLLAAGVCRGAGPDDVLGVWKSEGEKSHVEIYKCGGAYCGRIVWLKEPVCDGSDGPAGAAKTDRNNPDPARKGRPIIGLQIMEGFTAAGGNRWEKGTIYDPENGRTYNCRMKLASPERLEVRGYIGISLVGRTTVWTR